MKTNSNFEAQVNNEFFSALAHERQISSDVNLSEFKTKLCNEKIDLCLGKASLAIVHKKEGQKRYFIAFAWVWANYAGIKIVFLLLSFFNL